MQSDLPDVLDRWCEAQNEQTIDALVASCAADAAIPKW